MRFGHLDGQSNIFVEKIDGKGRVVVIIGDNMFAKLLKAEFIRSDDAMNIVNDYEYRFKYSNYYMYHPFHALSMLSGGSASLLWTSAIFLPGSKAPGYARGMGFIPTSTFEDAMESAKRIVGDNPRILCTPECFSGGVGVHLHRKNGS